MKTIFKLVGVVLVLLGGHLILSSFMAGSLQALGGTRLPPMYHFPYRQAGLTERQAAAHLLGRFTYGAMPGQVDAVVSRGWRTGGRSSWRPICRTIRWSAV
jgi:hypothetical protein